MKDDDLTPVMDFRPRPKRLVALLDAAREYAELRGTRAEAPALARLEEAAFAWSAEECPICGRRGDHEWDELTFDQKLAHDVEASRQP